MIREYWKNWETWRFWLVEADAIQMSVNVGDTLEDLENIVFTHLSFLAEDERVPEIILDFAQPSFEDVHTDQIAEVMYEQLKEAYELT